MKSSRNIIGLLVTLIVILALVGTRYGMTWWDEQQKPEITQVHCLVGGEKMSFLADPEVKQILADNGLEIDATRQGSIEMVSDPQSLDESIDCVWPSNQVALSMYRNNGGNVSSAENVFNSPIVVYSWTPVTNALIEQGVVAIEPNPAVADANCAADVPEVERTGCVYYLDFERLTELIESGATWADIGMTQLYGPIKVHSTNPTRSNSGNMYSALLANTMADGPVATEAGINAILPRIAQFFENQGFMSESSGDIFEQYLEQGMGTYPLMVGYESQIVEFSHANREHENLSSRINNEVRVLYPRPTVWSQHPLISRNADGDRLLQVLLSDDVQKIAWESHGFRSGAGDSARISAEVPIANQIPPDILSVVDMPSVGTMTRILDGLENPESIAPPGSTPARRDDATPETARDVPRS